MNILKRTLKIIGALLALLILALTIATRGFGVGNFGMSEEEVAAFFQAHHQLAPHFTVVDTHPGRIGVAALGEQPKNLVFIHGSPGTWDAFIYFFTEDKLTRRARIVSVDRPGFGASRPYEAVPSLKEQARRIKFALDNIGVKNNAVLVGHSLGGPVAVRLAADYPQLVAGLLLVAPSMDPELEHMRWYNYVAYYPPASWILPRDWVISNNEIMPHKLELQALAGVLDEIQVPTIVIQGMNDELVPPANANYIERHMTSAPLEIRRREGVNHFIPWNQPGLIENAAIELLDSI